jgi:hypothetical protein
VLATVQFPHFLRFNHVLTTVQFPHFLRLIQFFYPTKTSSGNVESLWSFLKRLGALSRKTQMAEIPAKTEEAFNQSHPDRVRANRLEAAKLLRKCESRVEFSSLPTTFGDFSEQLRPKPAIHLLTEVTKMVRVLFFGFVLLRREFGSAGLSRTVSFIVSNIFKTYLYIGPAQPNRLISFSFYYFKDGSA